MKEIVQLLHEITILDDNFNNALEMVPLCFKDVTVSRNKSMFTVMQQWSVQF